MLLDAAAMTDEERIAIAGMKRSGVKAKDIARRFGISTAMVARVAKECGARRSLDGRPGLRRHKWAEPHIAGFTGGPDDLG